MPKKVSKPNHISVKFKLFIIAAILIVALIFAYNSSSAAYGFSIRFNNIQNNSNYTTYHYVFNWPKSFKVNQDDQYYLHVFSNCERYGVPAKGTDPDSDFEWHIYDQLTAKDHLQKAQVLSKYVDNKPMVNARWEIKNELTNQVVASGTTKAPTCTNVDNAKVIFPINYSTGFDTEESTKQKYQFFHWTMRILDTNLKGNAKMVLDTTCINEWTTNKQFVYDTNDVSEWINDWELGGYNFYSRVYTAKSNVSEGTIPYKFYVNDSLVASGSVKGPVCSNTTPTKLVASEIIPSTGLIVSDTFSFALRNQNISPKNLYHALALGYVSKGRTILNYLYFDRGYDKLNVTKEAFAKGIPDRNTKLAVILLTSDQYINNGNLNKQKLSKTYQYTIDIGGGTLPTPTPIVTTFPSGTPTVFITGPKMQESEEAYYYDYDFNIKDANSIGKNVQISFDTSCNGLASNHKGIFDWTFEVYPGTVQNGRQSFGNYINKGFVVNKLQSIPFKITMNGQLLHRSYVKGPVCTDSAAAALDHQDYQRIDDGGVYYVYNWNMVFNKKFANLTGPYKIEIATNCEGKARRNNGKFSWNLNYISDFDFRNGFVPLQNELFEQYLKDRPDLTTSAKYTIYSNNNIVSQGLTYAPLCN